MLLSRLSMKKTHLCEECDRTSSQQDKVAGVTDTMLRSPKTFQICQFFMFVSFYLPGKCLFTLTLIAFSALAKCPSLGPLDQRLRVSTRTSILPFNFIQKTRILLQRSYAWTCRIDDTKNKLFHPSSKFSSSSPKFNSSSSS